MSDHGGMVLSRTTGGDGIDHVQVENADALIGVTLELLAAAWPGVRLVGEQIVDFAGHRYRLEGFCPEDGLRVLHFRALAVSDGE